MPINLDDQLSAAQAFSHQQDMRRLSLIGEDGLHTLNAVERLSLAEKAMMTDDSAMDAALRTAIHVPTVDK